MMKILNVYICQNFDVDKLDNCDVDGVGCLFISFKVPRNGKEKKIHRKIQSIRFQTFLNDAFAVR